MYRPPRPDEERALRAGQPVVDSTDAERVEAVVTQLQDRRVRALLVQFYAKHRYRVELCSKWRISCEMFDAQHYRALMIVESALQGCPVPLWR